MILAVVMLAVVILAVVMLAKVVLLSEHIAMPLGQTITLSTILSILSQLCHLAV
ncbi:hypothetical protein [Yersinia kristensenii]|uniref:hypothetical protein n=1 Tax=Yersinia kristensenii TaxID=28152 RepID=UPI000A645560|nr:hypothetical protein [Yersinia kristensenii]QKJ17588.1 hypothetical protein HRD70_21790 [Yersinia kristensenii]